MKDTEKELRENYSRSIESVTFRNKEKLYELYDKKRGDPPIRRIVFISAAAAAFLVALAVTAAANNMSLSDLVHKKTAKLDITDEKRDQMTERIAAWGISPTDFSTYSHEIRANSFGETYGSLFDGVDLIAVGGTENGEDITGYVYALDYSYIVFNDIYSDFSIDMPHMNSLPDLRWIYVYDSEGVVPIGKFINGGFKTNDQLNDDETKHAFACGNAGSADKYAILAAYRTVQKNITGSAVVEKNISELDFSTNSMYRDPNKQAVSCYEDDNIVSGFIYKNELNELKELGGSWNDPSVRNWVYVYSPDGADIIGKYVIDKEDSGVFYGENNEWEQYISERENTLAEFSYGFKTNKQLEDPIVKKYIFDGSDGYIERRSIGNGDEYREVS